MDKINLNLFGLNFQKPLEKKEDEEAKAPVEEKAVEKNDKAVEQEKMLSAMALSAAQNKAFVGGVASLPNPADYLDAASIARIQASMGVFEKTVENYKNAVDAEFGSTLTEAQKQALALKAAAQNI